MGLGELAGRGEMDCAESRNGCFVATLRNCCAALRGGPPTIGVASLLGIYSYMIVDVLRQHIKSTPAAKARCATQQAHTHPCYPMRKPQIQFMCSCFFSKPCAASSIQLPNPSLPIQMVRRSNTGVSSGSTSQADTTSSTPCPAVTTAPLQLGALAKKVPKPRLGADLGTNNSMMLEYYTLCKILNWLEANPGK